MAKQVMPQARLEARTADLKLTDVRAERTQAEQARAQAERERAAEERLATFVLEQLYDDLYWQGRHEAAELVSGKKTDGRFRVADVEDENHATSVSTRDPERTATISRPVLTRNRHGAEVLEHHGFRLRARVGGGYYLTRERPLSGASR